MENLDISRILGYGAIGLGCILAVLAYQLLRSEQRVNPPRPPILTSIYVFMAFSLALTALGFVGEYAKDTRSADLAMQLALTRAKNREVAESLDVLLQQKEVAALRSNATPEIRGHVEMLQKNVARLRDAGS